MHMVPQAAAWGCSASFLRRMTIPIAVAVVADSSSVLLICTHMAELLTGGPLAEANVLT